MSRPVVAIPQLTTTATTTTTTTTTLATTTTTTTYYYYYFYYKGKVSQSRECVHENILLFSPRSSILRFSARRPSRLGIRETRLGENNLIM